MAVQPISAAASHSATHLISFGSNPSSPSSSSWGRRVATLLRRCNIFSIDDDLSSPTGSNSSSNQPHLPTPTPALAASLPSAARQTGDPPGAPKTLFVRKRSSVAAGNRAGARSNEDPTTAGTESRANRYYCSGSSEEHDLSPAPAGPIANVESAQDSSTFCQSAASAPLRPIRRHRHHRCTISLFFGLLIPAVIVAAVFFSLSWVMVHKSAVDSIEMVSSRLHQMTMLHLSSAIEQLLDSLAVTSQVAAANIDYNTSVANVNLQLFNIISRSTKSQYVTFTRPDGLVQTYRRDDAGVLYFADRPADCNSSACSVGSMWMINALGEKARLLYSVPYDPRNTPWFEAAIARNRSSFAPPFSRSLGAASAISYAIPLFYPDGRLYAVMAACYVFNTLTTLLQEAQKALQISGILLLMDDDGFVLSSSSSLQSNVSALSIADRRLLLTLPVAHTQTKVSIAQLTRFGESYVLHITLDSTTAGPSLSVPLDGIDWRVFIIIPKSDYFSELDQQKRSEIGLISGCVVCFIVLIALSFRMLLTLPLRRLLKQLRILQKLLLDCRKPDVVISTSNFTEFAVLHLSILDVLQAAENSVEQRAKELLKATEAEAANEQTQRLMRAKEIFFAMMSHEMRTPLTACIGMAEVLLGTDLTPLQKECGEAIVYSGGLMLTLVNNLLDFSKMEADRLVLEKLPFHVRKTVELAAQTIQINAEEKQLELIVDIAHDIPEEIVGDANRLTQVLLNLLSNAVKFTHTGMVILRCFVSANGCQLWFEVQDTGIGLSEDTLASLFQPFVQGDNTISRQFGGTGLGLVISQRLIHLMGGSLQVTSHGAGQGSTFSFALPLDPATSFKRGGGERQSSSPKVPAPHPHAPQYPSAEPVTVMIVDAQPRRQHALTELFRALRVHSEVVPDLEHLPQKLMTTTQQFLPQHQQLVLLLHLDEHLQLSSPAASSVIDLVEKLRGIARPYSSSPPTDVKIVFLVAMKNAPSTVPMSNVAYISRPISLGKMVEAFSTLSLMAKKGVNSHGARDLPASHSSELVRSMGLPFPPSAAMSILPQSNPHFLTQEPVSSPSRKAAILTSLSASELTSPSRSPTQIPNSTNSTPGNAYHPITATSSSCWPPPNARVLIVDDVPLNLRVMSLKLQQKGFSRIELAASGVAALQACTAPEPFDLILMDIMMPEMDGYEATRRIKALSAYRTVPVIGVTGNTTQEGVAGCFQAGMAAVLAKPIENDRFFAVLQEHLGPNRSGGSAEDVV